MAEQKSKTRSLVKQVEIEAPVEAVWKALTDAEELTNWFPLDAKVRPGPGGSIWMSWRNEYQFETPIEIWQPNKRLKLVYSGEGDATLKVPSQICIDYHLESRGNKTILRLVHSGFSADTDWDDWFEGTHLGWDYQLWGLQHYLKYHAGKKRGVIHVRHSLDKVTRQQAWDALMGRAFFPEGRITSLKAGEQYAFQTPSGETYSGVIRSVLQSKDFVATVANLNNGTLRIQFDEFWGKRDVVVTLSTYGLQSSRVEKMRENWAALFKKLFG